MSVSVSKLGFIGWAGAVGVGRLAVGYRIGYLGRCVNQLIVTQLVVLDYICCDTRSTRSARNTRIAVIL